MRFVFLTFICFSFSSQAETNIIIKWPKKELKEMIIWGFYTRENQEEIEEAEKMFRSRGFLKEGESVEEKFSHLELGKEKYNRSGQLFCYEGKKEETKVESRIFNPNLKVQLYDKGGNLLSEDFLRDSNPKNSTENSYEWSVISYVPYHKEGHDLQVVRFEVDNKIILEKLEFHSLEKLRKEIEENPFYAYRYSGNCYLSPPLR